MSNYDFKSGLEVGEETVSNFSCEVAFTDVCRISEDQLPDNNGRNQFHMVEAARDYMHDNFWKKISVEEVAKNVFVSQYHFSRIFKKHTRYSPYQYLLHVRLRQARNLMYRKELTITDISFQSGFSSVDYFSAAFTKRYAVCPSVYRKMLF